MQLWSIWASHATPQVLLASSCFSSEFDFGAASFRIQDLGTVQQGVQQHTHSRGRGRGLCRGRGRGGGSRRGHSRSGSIFVGFCSYRDPEGGWKQENGGTLGSEVEVAVVVLVVAEAVDLVVAVSVVVVVVVGGVQAGARAGVRVVGVGAGAGAGVGVGVGVGAGVGVGVGVSMYVLLSPKLSASWLLPVLALGRLRFRRRGSTVVGGQGASCLKCPRPLQPQMPSS